MTFWPCRIVSTIGSFKSGFYSLLVLSSWEFAPPGTLSTLILSTRNSALHENLLTKDGVHS